LGDTFQLTLGGTFGAGPAWQNRVETGAVLPGGDSFYAYGADSMDLRSGKDNWQGGFGYRRPLLKAGRHALNGTLGLQHWRFPAVKTGTKDWLTYENLSYQTRLANMPIILTADSWSLLASRFTRGTLLHSHLWLERPIFAREPWRLAVRIGPAHTYSWDFWGTHGHRIVRYQSMAIFSWGQTRVEVMLRKQRGLQPGIPPNTYWQFAWVRTLVH